MTVLEQARTEIDAIDKELMKLFEKRMHVVSQVAMYKKENNLEIFHPKREQQVIINNVARLEDKQLIPYAEKFLQDMMNVSKEYQKAMIADKDE